MADRVPIAGGAGFIGADLADRRVIVPDSLSRPGVEHNVRHLCDTYGDLERLGIL